VSVQAVLGAAGSPSALAASERVERLQALLAQVERGPSGFASALDAAQASAQATPMPSTDEASSVSYASAAPAGTVGSEASAGSGAPGSYTPLIEQAARRNGLDPAVLYGLIKQESGFDPSARSSAGALGLTQLMPGTASSLGVTEPLNPAQSVEGGARYLAQLLRQFGGNVTDALAGYNAGPGAVEQYGGVPPYGETQQYVANVLGNAAAYRQNLSGSPAGASPGADLADTASAGTAYTGSIPGVNATTTGVIA